jgi:hypothetical protein
MEDAKASVFLGVFIKNGAGFIGGAVVDAKAFPIGKRLGKYGV